MSGHQTPQDAPGRARLTRVDCPGQGEQQKRLRHLNDAQRILGRLVGGPATSLELAAICPLGYRQRLSDLRKKGHSISCDEDKASGRTVYTLEVP